MTDDERSPGRDWVAVIIAVGLCTLVNLIAFAVLWDALFSQMSGLSENATQILTSAIGGMTGILGSFIGFRAGAASTSTKTAAGGEHDDTTGTGGPV